MPGVKLTDVNPELVCVLCHGYFIDATAIKECLHSFCRSCIILYLEAKNYCPKCQVPINTSKPHLSLKPDKTRQDIVYKLVPGLFHSEMRRRQEFYKKHCHRDLHLHPEARGVDVDRLIYSPEDSISLSLEYYDSDKEKEDWCNGEKSLIISGSSTPKPVSLANGTIGPKGSNSSNSPSKSDTGPTSQSSNKQLERSIGRKRYLQCPAEVSMRHLKKFIRMKYELPPEVSVELFYKRESLPDDYSLIDIAYIYTWKRNGPMRFYYRIHVPRGASRANSCQTLKEETLAPESTARTLPVAKPEPEPPAPAVLATKVPPLRENSIPDPEIISIQETHPLQISHKSKPSDKSQLPVVSQSSPLLSQSPPVIPQSISLASPNPRVISKCPPIVSEGPPVIPAGPPVVSQSSSPIPQSSLAVPQGPSVVPQGASVVPQGASVVPQGASVVPQGPSAVPQGASVVPQGPSVVPQGPPILPQGQSGVPQSSAMKNDPLKVTARLEESQVKHAPSTTANIIVTTPQSMSTTSKSRDICYRGVKVPKVPADPWSEYDFTEEKLMNFDLMNINNKTGLSSGKLNGISKNDRMNVSLKAKSHQTSSPSESNRNVSSILVSKAPIAPSNSHLQGVTTTLVGSADCTVTFTHSKLSCSLTGSQPNGKHLPDVGKALSKPSLSGQLRSFGDLKAHNNLPPFSKEQAKIPVSTESNMRLDSTSEGKAAVDILKKSFDGSGGPSDNKAVVPSVTPPKPLNIVKNNVAKKPEIVSPSHHESVGEKFRRLEKQLAEEKRTNTYPIVKLDNVNKSLNQSLSSRAKIPIMTGSKQNENKGAPLPARDNKSLQKTVTSSNDIAEKKPSNFVAKESPKKSASPSAGNSSRKLLTNGCISPKAATLNSSPSDIMKRKRSEMERCIETENGCLSVSLLSQSQQEAEAKKMKMVKPDVSIQLMSYSRDKKADAAKATHQNRPALSESLKAKDNTSCNESQKLCVSTKANISPTALQPIHGQKREHVGPLDLSSGLPDSSAPGGGSSIKTIKSSPSPTEKRRKMPPLAPIRVPGLSSLAELSDRSSLLQKSASNQNEQKSFSKLPKETIELLLRHQFNNNNDSSSNNKNSGKLLDDFVMNCQNYAYTPPYPMMRPSSGLSPESVRK